MKRTGLRAYHRISLNLGRPSEVFQRVTILGNITDRLACKNLE